MSNTQNEHHVAPPAREDEFVRGEEQEKDDLVEPEGQNKRSRQSQSWVWNHLTKIGTVDGKEMCRCNHCKKPLSCQTKSGTSHLIRHLENKCLYYKRDGKGQTLLNVFTSDEGSTISSWKFNPEHSRSELVKWIISGEMPFTVVENPKFHNFVGSLQPKYNVMSRFTLKRDCMKLYEVEKKNLLSLLNKSGARICITTDMWSSVQNLGYMVITAHFIDDCWKLHKKIMSFSALALRHTGDNIADMMITKLASWNITKLCTLTADNASTNDVVTRNLVDHYATTSSLLLGGRFFRVRCWAHILNLIVQDGLSEIGEIIGKIRTMVKCIKYSTRRHQEFLDYAGQERIPVTKSLKLDVSTRWNSTFLMLESATLYQKVFNRMKTREFQLMDVPSPSEWKKVELIKGILENFYAATNFFSGQKYATANLFFCLFFEIEKELISLQHNKDASIRNMATKMFIKFDKYWTDKEAMLPLAIAIVLDPRYKFEFLRFSYTELYSSEEVAEYVGQVEAVFQALYDEYALKFKGMEGAENAMQRPIECDPCEPRVKEDTRLKFLKQKKVLRYTDSGKSELQLYLEDDSADNVDDSTFDILLWWQLNASKYRILSHMARNILVIPVSTVASESAFSTGGRVLDAYRSRLHPKTVEALICTQDWIRGEVSDSVDDEEEDDDAESIKNPSGL